MKKSEILLEQSASGLIPMHKQPLNLPEVVHLLVKLVSEGAVIHETDYTCSESQLFLNLTHPNGTAKSYSIVQEDITVSGGGESLAVDILLDNKP